MKLADVPMAMTSLQPFCPCGTALAWPDRTSRNAPTEPVLLTCQRCHTIVRAAYLVSMPEPQRAVDGRSPAGGFIAAAANHVAENTAHPSHEYRIEDDTCARCGEPWTRAKASGLAQLNPAMREACRYGSSTGVG